MTDEDVKELIAHVAGVRKDLDAMLEILAEMRPLIEQAVAASSQARAALMEGETAVSQVTDAYRADYDRRDPLAP